MLPCQKFVVEDFRVGQALTGHVGQSKSSGHVTRCFSGSKTSAGALRVVLVRCGSCSGSVMLSGALLLCLVVGLQLRPSRAQYDPDEVRDLPGMTFKPKYRQWSGYLQARPGSFLHYW